MRHRTLVGAVAGFLGLLPFVTLAFGEPKDTSQEPIFKGLKARSIGPALMGGRVSDIALDPKDPYTFYVTLGTGGVMKTSDNGSTFSGVFEKEAVAAVGAVAVAPSSPRTLWVGTGEANDRNSSSWGDGVYLSTDGGGSWKNMGLKSSRTIARIAVPAADSMTAYVAAMGDLWNPGGERGLYKTTDAGKSWKLVLAAPGTEKNVTGCGDVVLDPKDPNVVYATLYARRRRPWSFAAGPAATGGADVGGIFKSTDAGATWTRLEKGLPKGTTRIGLSIYAKNPRILYAVVGSDEGGTQSIDDVKSKAGGVFTSTDAGETWTRVNELDPRPFYFSQIRVDPSDSSKVYVLGFMLHASLDGGRTFREDRSKKIHPDCHALVIDPSNPKRLLLGTDGGLYTSYSAAKEWIEVNHFAGGEFYRITLDNSTPYRIAGGLQDNLNWVGPSRTWTKDGIQNSDWTNLEGGDGFSCAFDPDDSNVIYAESQQGHVHRFNLANREAKVLRPEPAEGHANFRFHWNAPLLASTHARGTLYLGGNQVFKLWDKGEKWAALSGDLSARAPDRIVAAGSGAENYGVVYTLAESPVKEGLLWAGTDDGKLWMTRDEGGKWTDLTNNLPQSVKGQWLSRIEASHFDADIAYLAVDAHRSGDFKPYAFRTIDGGRSWTSLAGDLPALGPVKVVREDPVNRNLLFAGTEFNLFMSRNGGKHWAKLGQLPTVAVDDIAVHPRDRDLVIATHGRSLYILDDIRPLEQMADSIETKAAYLFPPRPAFGTNLFSGWAWSAGSGGFRGENPPEGAIINYYLKEYTADPLKLSVEDSTGQAVANLTASAYPGLNRATWDLKTSPDLLNDYGGEGQLFVKPGTYTVSLTYGEVKQKQKIQVDIAPGLETR